MSVALEEQVKEKVVGLSEDNLIFLNNLIDKYMRPQEIKEPTKRIGIKKGQKMYADGYDYDEMNDVISRQFVGGDK